MLLEAIRQTKPGPPMVARSIAIVYTCIYDAWAAYEPVAKPTQSGIAQRPVAENTVSNKEKAVHYAAFRSLSDQFPQVKSLFIDKMVVLGLDPTDTSTDVTTSIGIGNEAANLVLAFRQTDGANEAGNYADTSGYVTVNPPLNPHFPSTVEEIPHPDRWQKLIYLTSESRPASPNYIAPHWGSVIPFALTSGHQFRPEPTAIYHIPRFFRPSQTRH